MSDGTADAVMQLLSLSLSDWPVCVHICRRNARQRIYLNMERVAVRPWKGNVIYSTIGFFALGSQSIYCMQYQNIVI